MTKTLGGFCHDLLDDKHVGRALTRRKSRPGSLAFSG